MVTKEQVLDVLRDVEDPEVHKSIVELDMVKNIEIEEGRVNVEVLLTIRGCPLRTIIEKEVEERILSLPGVKQVNVQIGHMTDEQRAAFTAKVRGENTGSTAAPQQQAVPALLRGDKPVQFLAIASGKGGVGKSTVTANLAVALARQGVRVAVIDADIYGFSIPAIFGVQDKKPTVIDELIMPIEVEGVKLISMQFFVPKDTPVVWRGPMLGKMLRNFFGQVHWGDVDVVLLDLPPGTGDMALDVHSLLPNSKQLIVTTPQAAASAVAVRAGLMGVRTNHEVIGVVENMAYFQFDDSDERAYIFGRGGGEQVASQLNTELLIEIPIANLDKQKDPLFDESSLQGQAYRQLAERVGMRLGVKTQPLQRNA
ncbi:iron-sulfur cluster carrier protein [Alicyclobacillus acidoterrestris]|uniref:Mrp/NBP35 family ATP-binding protein n=1 Tax=Alicyclobacillus suci TaxID=2816080 RepID=UPI001192F54A|nr:Mrp/NBP35 family ATP-binding protein [Alicyclobacillus suci]GEO26763.1 iron-sulfur cluster carrier protein [Alicyclobacillus acidoterrestris]